MSSLLAVLAWALLSVPGVGQPVSPATSAAPPQRAADIARQIKEAGLDAAECYRVRDLTLAREDVRLFFTEGYLIFGKPIAGRRVSAVFSGEVEGGDGEILLLPPNKSERLSLARFTGSPNLDEHFRSAVLIFTDDAAQALERMVSPEKKSAEMGALLSERYRTVVANLSSSFEMRLTGDLLGSRGASFGLFYAALSGATLGNFDVVYDPLAARQIVLGQVAFRNERAYFDTWATFDAKSVRTGSRQTPPVESKISRVRIDATVGTDLNLNAVTRFTAAPTVPGAVVLPFEVSRHMRIKNATVDGQRAEVFQREGLREGLLRANDDDVFLVLPPQPLEMGRGYEFEFEHEGKVIERTGEGVYFVGARASWYPHRGLQFATYDITFHYPKELGMVATGEMVEDRTEGDQHITRRRTLSEVRMAGFNLGEFVKTAETRAGYTVEVYGNRKLDPRLEHPRDLVVVPPPAVPRPRRPNDVLVASVDLPPPNPNARLQELAVETAGALEFMAGIFGPAPLKTLVVAPIPGTFGQGFPGLVYLSTLSYLDAKDRPAPVRTELQRVFYSEILQAHEVAHQWLGNVVTSAGYEDEWMMEALSNYLALMYLEKRKGSRWLEGVLDDYRNRLLGKTESGETIESSGPIVWGMRLQSSLAPAAWRTITYEKGSWIIHMLRRRLGDQKFLAMLGELRRRYQYKRISTDQLRQLAASFLPPGSPDPKLEQFFESWVYGTGIPSLKVSQSVKGKAPAFRVTGTIAQGDVDNDFSAQVPVEVQTGPRSKPVVQWVETGSEPAPFTIAVRQRPLKVSVPPHSVLSR